MSRAFLVVMDSVGIGGAPDADRHVPDPAAVLQLREHSGLDDLEGALLAHDASTNRTVLPGWRSAGGSRSASHRTTSVVPMSCHPPGEDRG